MNQPKEKVKKPTETLSIRMSRLESTLKEFQAQLERRHASLETVPGRIDELDHRIAGQIASLESRIKERNDAGVDPDSCITLEEGQAVNLDELEKKMEEQYSLLVDKEKAFRDIQRKLSIQVKNLIAKNNEKSLLLAAKEMEFKNFKLAMETRVAALESLVKSQREGRKTGNRLMSFLVDRGRKN